MNRTSLIVIFVVSFTISLLSNAAEKFVEKKASAPDEVTLDPNSSQFANLKIESVIEITAPTTSDLNGKIIFNENYTARINSPILGRVLRIKAQIGDTVKAGQVLMILDSPDLGSALADAHKADADLQLKRKSFERNSLLLEGGVIARKEQENSQADLLESEAEAQRANAHLKNLGAQRNGDQNYVLRTPIAGVVIDRQANPGTEVRPDAAMPLFVITNPNHLWASVDLPERELGKIYKGQTLAIHVEAYPDEIFTGKVESIGVMVDPTTRRITIRCSLESKGKLKPEMYARITPLNTKNSKVISIPNTALITEGLYSYVFVETSPGHFKKQRVLLNSQEHDFATIKNGLVVGEHVITSGAILLNSELAVNK